ncbi:MAG: hypothetical protein ABEJ34_07800 [Haloferacaceae archaeon]
MTDDTPTDVDRAERYLQHRPGDGSDGSVPDGVPPEAADYMDGPSAGAATLSAAERTRRLETAVRALVDALADGDRPSNATTDRAAAFVDGGTAVVVDEDLGELIAVDRGTAALMAFAYGLNPGPTG